PAVAEPARRGARQREAEREVAPAPDDLLLREAAERRPDRHTPRQCAAREPPEPGEERRRRVGERVVAEERERERRDAPARAVHRAEAREEEFPSRKVVGRERGPPARHAAPGDAPVPLAVEQRRRQVQANERRDPHPAPAERGEEAIE